MPIANVENIFLPAFQYLATGRYYRSRLVGIHTIITYFSLVEERMFVAYESVYYAIIHTPLPIREDCYTV